MTLKQVKATGKEYGFSVRKIEGEYRVNLAGGTETTAYYTNDAWDAQDTGIAMVRYAALRRISGEQIKGEGL